MPDFQLNYSGEQVNTAIGNGLNAITTESGQVLTTNQQQVVQQKIGLPELFSHTAPPIIETVNGSVVSVTDASDQNAVSLISHIEPVQEGSGEPSPDNVRAISGWNAVQATRAGKNLLDANMWETTIKHGITVVNNGDGSVAVSGTNDLDTVYNFPSTIRTTLKPGEYTNGGVFNKEDGVYPVISYKKSDGSTGYLSNKGQIYISHESEIVVYLQVAAGATVNATVKPQLEVGEIATAYEPYQGQILTAELPETVYGGTLNWNAGVLDVSGELRMFNGNEYWSDNSSQGFYATPLADENSAYRGTVVCSHYQSAEVALVNGRVLRFYVVGEHPTLDSWKAFLAAQSEAGTPVSVVVNKNTPYTIQITTQQLDMLKGTNNVWSDTGDTELSYVADTKLYINKQIASIATTAQNG